METFLQSLQHQLEEERKRREWYQRLHAALEIDLEMILDDFEKKEKTCQKRIEELNAEIHLLRKTLKEESSAVLQLNAARRLLLTVVNDKRTEVSRLHTLLEGRNAQQKEPNRALKMKLKDLEKRVKYTSANQALLNLEMRKHKATLGRLEALLEEERNAQPEKSNTSFNKKVVVDLEENLQTTFATKVRVDLEMKEYKAEVGRLKALLEDRSAHQEE